MWTLLFELCLAAGLLAGSGALIWLIGQALRQEWRVWRARREMKAMGPEVNEAIYFLDRSGAYRFTDAERERLDAIVRRGGRSRAWTRIRSATRSRRAAAT